MAVFTAIATAIASGLGMSLAAASTATFIAVTAASLQLLTSAIFMFGGMALSAALTKKGVSNSPTYANPTLQTQTNPDLPVPLLYGTVKLAGNRIWQNSSSSAKIKRVVAFAEGEIEDFTDIRLNDIKSNKVSGCKIQKFYGTNDQALTSLNKLDKLGSLRNIAYLAVTCNKTSKIDINYNLTSVVKGRKIRVYTSPTQYEVKYSENPAWVLFDFLTAYNGLGIALDNECNVNDDLVSQYFDLETFIESAAYCDELIPFTDNDGKTSYYPRFTFNMIFDSQTSARDLIDEIYRSCRGGLFTHNGKLQFKIDKPEPVSQVFTGEDIIKGSETFQVIPTEEHYEILRCTYVSPDHEWQKVEAFAELSEYRYGAPVEHSVNLYSCTNFQQASRLAWYYINSKTLCPFFGSFQTDYRAYTLEVGDVIQIDSLLMGLNDYLVKVTSVSDDGTGVFTVNWRNYDERLYSDELGSKEPRVLVSDLSDIEAYPEDVRNFNVVQSQTYFNFVWTANEDVNDTYEIRVGDSWENGTVIGKNIQKNNFTWSIPYTGLFKFWIKAFNRYNYSLNPTLDVFNVDSIPHVNEIVKIDILSDIDGEFDNTYRYHNKIKLNTNNVLWNNLEDTWQNDSGYYQINGIWGAEVINSGSYTSQIYDIGADLKSLVSFGYNYISYDESQTIEIQWRYSEDNEIWTDWVNCNDGEYNFRYCQMRAVFNAYSNAQITLTNFIVNIDVPDKEIEMDIEVPEEGSLHIEYNFVKEPSIIGTVNDDINAFVVIKDKTNTSATVHTYLNTGEPTRANVNLRLRGY